MVIGKFKLIATSIRTYKSTTLYFEDPIVRIFISKLRKNYKNKTTYFI